MWASISLDTACEASIRVIFYDKSDGEVKLAVQLYKSAVQLYKSADIKVKLRYTPRNFTYQRSN